MRRQAHLVPRALGRLAGRTVVLAALLTSGLGYGVVAAMTRLQAGAAARGSLSITGTLTVPLTPGVGRAVDARLANGYGFALSLTRLTIGVTVDAGHARAGCSSGQDFRVHQLPAATYPILLPARTTATLRELGVRRLPRLAMVNRADADQSACRGASLQLRYRAAARRAGSAVPAGVLP